MNRLSIEKRASVVRALVEGNSIRSTVRITGIAKNTVVRLLADLGMACFKYHDKTIRDINSKRIQCDEIWSFCYAKQKNIPKDKRGIFGYGDVWTWTALDSDSKLMVSWFIGSRDTECARHFLQDLKDRLAGRVQLTTDGHKAYIEAVDDTFGADIDYAMLVKLYGKNMTEPGRYSPPKCVGARRKDVTGKPDRKTVSTSYVERQNLTMRMSMRRFTRLTNGFSKKIENLEHAVALHFMYYNFVRIHKSLRVTPAMAAGVTDRLWEIEDIVKLLENTESK